MSNELVVGQPKAATLPSDLQRAISRSLELDYSAPQVGSTELISSAKGWLDRYDKFLNLCTAEARQRQFDMLGLQPWYLPNGLRGSDEDRLLFWAAYHADLADIPDVILPEACQTARLESRQFPTSGQLRAYAHQSPRYRAALREREGLRRLAQARPVADGVEYATAEQFEALRARIGAV